MSSARISPSRHARSATPLSVTEVQRRVLSTGPRGDVERLHLSDDDAWQLVQWAERERVLPLLSVELSELEVAPSVVEYVAEGLRTHLLTSLQLEAMLGESARCLTRAGIPNVWLKGVAVARVAYPQPELRQIGDVDVLVPPEAFGDACHELRSLGASPIEEVHFGPVTAEARRKAQPHLLHGVEIDLHRRVEAGLQGIELETSAFFDAGHQLRLHIAGIGVTVPSVELMLVHASIHLASRNARISTLADIGRLIDLPELRPDVLTTVSARPSVVPVVQWAVRQWQTLGPLNASGEQILQLDCQRGADLRTRYAISHPRAATFAWHASRVHPRSWPRLVAEAVWPSESYLRTQGRSHRSHLMGMGRACLSMFVRRTAEIRAEPLRGMAATPGASAAAMEAGEA